MNTFHLVISSPDGNLYDGKAAALSIRGVDGDLTVMAGHLPFVTAVKPCECRITLPDGSKRAGYVKGGLLSVSKETTTLLSAGFHW